jgi:hypothetical protein
MRTNHSLFQIGYLNEKSRGNVDIDMYNDSCGELENMYSKVTGGIFKRVGTHMVGIVSGNNLAPPYNLVCRSFPFYLRENRLSVQCYPRRDDTYAYISAKFYDINGALKSDGSDIVLNIIRVTASDKDISTLLGNMIVFQGSQSLFITFSTENITSELISPDDIGHFIVIKENKNALPNQNPFMVSTLRYSFAPFGESMPYALRPVDAKNVENGTFAMRLYGNKSSYKITGPNDSQKYKVEVTYVYLSQSESNRVAKDIKGKLIMLSYDGGSDKPTESWCVIVTDASSQQSSESNYYVQLQCTVIPDFCPKAAKGGVQALPLYVETTSLEGDATTNNILVFRWNSSLVWATDAAIHKIDSANPTIYEMHDNRLFVAGSPNAPTFIYGSSRSKNDWFDFTPGVNVGDGIRQKLSIRYSESIDWAISGAELFLGSKEGIYSIHAGKYDDESISVFNFKSSRISPVSSSKVKPILGPNSVFFVDSSRRSIYEIIKDQNGEYDTNEISMLSDDLMQKKIVKLAYCNSPNKLLFSLLDDGSFCTLSYLKMNGVFSWSHHTLGGNCLIIDMHVTSDSDGDIVWFTTKRVLNGQEKVCLEYIKDQRNLDENYYVDFGKEFQIKRNIENVSVRDNFKIHSSKDLYSFLLDHEHHKFILYTLAKPADQKDRRHFVSGPFALDYVELEQTEANIYEVKDRWGNSCVCMEISPKLSNFSVDANVFVRLSLNKIDIDANRNVILRGVNSKVELSPNIKFIDTHANYNNGISIDFNSQRSEIWSVDVSDNPAYVSKNFYMRKMGDTTDYEVFTDTYYTTNLKLDANASINDQGSVFVFGTVANIKVPAVGTYAEIKITLDAPVDLSKIKSSDIYSSKAHINKIGSLDVDHLDLRVYYDINSSNILKVVQQRLDEYGNVRIISLDLGSKISKTFRTYGSELQKYFNSISGLGFLARENVALNINGNTSDNINVPDNGIIDFNTSVKYVSIGYNYKSSLKKLSSVFQSPYVGTTVGLTQHQKNIIVMLYKSLGGKYGSSFREDKLMRISYRRSDNGTIINNPERPFTGYVNLTMDNLQITESVICLSHDEPTPFNVLSITGDINVSDGAPEA